MLDTRPKKCCHIINYFSTLTLCEMENDSCTTFLGTPSHTTPSWQNKKYKQKKRCDMENN